MRTIAYNKMVDRYEFETDSLMGTIRVDTNYHGISGLMHKDFRTNAVRPEKSFLNVEYYTTKKYGRRFIPRELSYAGLCSASVEDDALTLLFPKEPLYGFELECQYRLLDANIHQMCTVRPTRDVEDLRIFFASYVCEMFDQTFAVFDEQAELVENRLVENDLYRVFADPDMQHIHRDEWEEHVRNTGRGKGMRNFYHPKNLRRPIYAARCSQNGMTLLFLMQNAYFYNISTQYHVWDTAHDWELLCTCRAQEPIRFHARACYVHTKDKKHLQAVANQQWEAFSSYIKEDRNRL